MPSPKSSSTRSAARTSTLGRVAPAKRREEIGRAFEGDDLAVGPDGIGKVGGGEAGAGADIEDGLAAAEPRAAEAVEHVRPPHAVLEAEARDFVVARSK